MSDMNWWQKAIMLALVCGTVAFSVDRCSQMRVDEARERANARRDWNFGLGKKPPPAEERK